MIFSLFAMTIRMASIEVPDYRKDGEVEARRDTRTKYYGEMADFSTDEVRSAPAPSAEGNKRPPMLDPLAELIRRYGLFKLLQPDRSQRVYRGPDRRPQRH